MSANTQVTTFLDLYTDLQERVREQTGVAATKAIAQRFINIALHDMHLGNGEKFPWCERQATLITQARYTDGTISVSKGSATITGVGTLWNTNNDFGVANMREGGKIVINGGSEVYEVSAIASDTSATLNSKYVTADVSGGGYCYFEDEYALDADFLRPLDLQNFDTRSEIRLTDRKTFRERYPRSSVTGKPVVAVIQDKGFNGSTAPVRKVRFWMPPAETYLIPYAFVTNKLAVSAAGVEQTNLSADDDEPIVPLSYRHAIGFHALYHMYRDRKDDARSATAKGEYTDVMLRVIGDTEVGAKRPRFAPIVGPYKSKARKPYTGTRGRRYTTGTTFDQMRD